MDEQTLTEETLAAQEAGDEARLQELARMEKLGNLDEAEPKYAEAAPSTSSSSTDTSGDLEQQIEQAAQLNELAGAENTAEALRRMKDAEDPRKALQKARRRADSVGDEYARGEFDDLLEE